MSAETDGGSGPILSISQHDTEHHRDINSGIEKIESYLHSMHFKFANDFKCAVLERRIEN